MWPLYNDLYYGDISYGISNYPFDIWLGLTHHKLNDSFILKGEKEKEEDPVEQPEFWEDLPDDVLRDINHKEPLPEPHERSSIMQKLTSLLQWFVLFMLLWQANCKLSYNGLEWLLRFLFQFLHLLGITCQCDYLVKFCTMFPTSLFVLSQ